MAKAVLARCERLLRMLEETGEMNVAELVNELSVSQATIRRDLAKLERQGKLIRSFGSARRVENSSYLVRTFGDKRLTMSKENARIARAAASLVQPGMVVALDSGTSAWHVAKALRGKAPLTILTASLPVLEELGGCDDISLICAGGEFRAANLDFVGPAATNAFSRMRADIAFFGADSIIPGKGVFSRDAESARVSAAIARVSASHAVVAEHSKFAETGLYLVLGPDDIDHVITDAGIASDLRRELASDPYELVVV